MLLLLDLDNMLIDRTGAFTTWAAECARRHGRDASDADWVVDADRDGYEPRERLAARIGERFGIDADLVLSELRAGVVAYTSFDPAAGQALVDASAAGFVPVVVTNGSVAQQETKLRVPSAIHAVLGL
jgi:putative hydrolase of the HAD superfamily